MMKDFERFYRKKQKEEEVWLNNVINKLKSSQKKRFDFVQHFQPKEIQKQLSNSFVWIETYDEFFRLLSCIDIGKCFNPPIPLNTFFPCYMVEGNIAWISLDKEGHCRYFSKPKRNHYVISLDLLDLVEIYYGVSTSEAVKILLEYLSIGVKEESWKDQQRKKYQQNRYFLHHLHEYPHLSSLISDHLHLLEMLNDLGESNLFNTQYVYQGHNLFFVSNSYLVNLVKNMSLSKTNRLLNLFATLGFIQKVPPHCIPPFLFQQSRRISELKKVGNCINYYIVLSFEVVAEEAERRAELLISNGIRFSNISKSGIERVFGREFAESIYVQSVQKNKNKRNKQRLIIEKYLEEYFVRLLNEYGYVTKSMVLSFPIPELEEKQKKRYLNEMWSYLLKTHQCEYFKPSKKIKEKLRLSSFEYIATKKGKKDEVNE